MDERRIEDILRAGPLDQPKHQQGSFARGLAARESARRSEVVFDTRIRARSSRGLVGLATAAALVITVTGFLAINRPDSGVSTSPSPSPSATSSPSPSPSATVGAGNGTRGAPVELVDRWVGPVRSIPSLDEAASRAFLVIQGAELRYDAGPGASPDLYRSSVAQESPDVLRLTAGTPNLGCEAFDEGRYRWSLSPDGTTLTLTLIDDACAERAAALPGAWVHTACRDPNQDCLGPIEAGTYRSTEFDPTHSGAAGQVRYTVPDGWANTSDTRLSLSLRPLADYLADPGFDGGDTVSGVYLAAGALAADQPDDCSAVPAPGVAATAEAIADHLATLDGVDVLDRRTSEIDGRTAYELDIDLAPDWSKACPWSNGDPFRTLFMFADLGVDGGVQGIGPHGGHHIWLVDAAPGRVLWIWVEGERSGFDGLLASARPIVESLRFGEAGTGP